jgi:hypothetical protein
MGGDLRETGWEGVDWIHQAEDRTSGWLSEHGNEPSGSIKSREFYN